eukprot:136643-Pelagomonas_calceolata.AAC.1
MIVSQPHLPDLLEWHGNHCEGDDEHHIFSIPPGICLLGSMQVQLGHRKPVTGFHWKNGKLLFSSLNKFSWFFDSRLAKNKSEQQQADDRCVQTDSWLAAQDCNGEGTR